MSVYKIIDIIGTSSNSWEEAAAEAVRTVRQTIRDVRVAEVIRQDIHLEDDGGITYRSIFNPLCLRATSKRHCDRFSSLRPEDLLQQIDVWNHSEKKLIGTSFRVIGGSHLQVEAAIASLAAHQQGCG